MIESSSIRIAAFSGYYGDRSDGLDEAISCEPDVLVGDYLAELTMLVLKKVKSRGGVGYAAGFVKELEPRLVTIARKGIKLVTNAGGLDPAGCAAAVKEASLRTGVNLSVAVVTGDDLLDRLQQLHDLEGQSFTHLDDGVPLDIDWTNILTANAYLGAWPIATALEMGADIVVCPRTTDASLIMGPAAWKHGWKPDEWHKLAGALMAGHLIECGPQVSGGNYSFFRELEDAGIPGMPYADIFPDGSSQIGKAPRTGGKISVDTLKAQLLYEIGGRDYLNPDVILDLQSVQLEQRSPQVVQVSGCRGKPPTSFLKVSFCYEGGYRNTLTVGLTGLDSSEKGKWIEHIIRERVGEFGSFDDFNVSMIGPADPGGPSYEGNTAWFVITAADRERSKVSREKFSSVLWSSIASALPGCYFTTPPLPEKQIAIQWPCLVEKRLVTPELRINGECHALEWGPYEDRQGSDPSSVETANHVAWNEPTVSCPIGRLFGTRSGDKGGTANLGIWARDENAWAWLDQWLTVEKLKELLPELNDLQIERHRLPNLFALNFLIRSFLGFGVSACLRIDSQAKGLGEYLGVRAALIPASLLSEDPSQDLREPAVVLRAGL